MILFLHSVRNAHVALPALTHENGAHLAEENSRKISSICAITPFESVATVLIMTHLLTTSFNRPATVSLLISEGHD